MIASQLLVGPLREEDGGVYRCRVDFREAPTRNTRIKLNLISKLMQFVLAKVDRESEIAPQVWHQTSLQIWAGCRLDIPLW